MPWNELQRVDEERGRELGLALQEVEREFARMPNMIPANPQGAAYATAIAQEVLDRMLPSRGYRVTAIYERGSRVVRLRLEEFVPEV